MQSLDSAPLNDTATTSQATPSTSSDPAATASSSGSAAWSVRINTFRFRSWRALFTISAGMGATRAIPGSQKMVTVAGNHYHPSMGSVVLLDVRRSRRTTEPMACITPEIPYRHTYSGKLPTGAFTDPYPLSEKFFLASYRAGGVTYKPGAEFGLCVLDAWGNRAEFLRDGQKASRENLESVFRSSERGSNSQFRRFPWLETQLLRFKSLTQDS